MASTVFSDGAQLFATRLKQKKGFPAYAEATLTGKLITHALIVIIDFEISFTDKNRYVSRVTPLVPAREHLVDGDGQFRFARQLVF